MGCSSKASRTSMSFPTRSKCSVVRLMSESMEKGDALEVLVARCAFCADGEAGKEPRCNFLAGVCAGTASEAYQREMYATELKCTRSGDPLCVISLRPARK